MAASHPWFFPPVPTPKEVKQRLNLVQAGICDYIKTLSQGADLNFIQVSGLLGANSYHEGGGQMPGFHDLRDYIDGLRKEFGEDEVRVVDGAHWDLEIGCLTEMLAEKEGPALLFDNIVGYPRGFRVLTNFMGTVARCAMALGIPTDLPKVEVMRAWKEKYKNVKLIPPKEVPTGAVMENVVEGDDIDLTMFPVPRWHDLDGGRYIGTADAVIVQDPDTGWTNLGTHRSCIQGKDKVSLNFLTGNLRHTHLIASKYWAKGQACPIAVVYGGDPMIFTASTINLAPGASEYDLAGGFRGAPVEVMRGPGTGLLIPANAEIVIEGEMLPIEKESVHEGPFGEWTGYYAMTGPEHVVRVKRIMYRNNPILLGAPPGLPTTTCGYLGLPFMSTLTVWNQLDYVGVPNIRGVWIHGKVLMVVISIKQIDEGHANMALQTALGYRRGGGMESCFVVVDDDIDPSDINQVLWAILTRVDPLEQVQILRSMTSRMDPRLSPEKKAKNDMSMGLTLINACKPYTWKDKFPATNRFADAAREKVRKQWRSKLPL